MVIWKKGDKTVLLLHNGKTTPEPGYSFAEPSWNESNMNVSLLITNTAVDHEGDYKCEVITDSGDDSSETTLRVTGESLQPWSTTETFCHRQTTLNTHKHNPYKLVS